MNLFVLFWTLHQAGGLPSCRKVHDITMEMHILANYVFIVNVKKEGLPPLLFDSGPSTLFKWVYLFVCNRGHGYYLEIQRTVLDTLGYVHVSMCMLSNCACGRVREGLDMLTEMCPHTVSLFHQPPRSPRKKMCLPS